MEKCDVRLELPSDYKNLCTIRNIVRSYLESENVAACDSVQIVSAIDELSTNIIEHAYKEREGNVTIELGMENDKLIVAVVDSGDGIDETKKSKEDGGLGLNIVKGIVDNLQFENKGNGTRVEFTKIVNKEES